MNKGYIFKNEEIKALKVFLSLFFIIFFVYDLAYEFIVPLIGGEQEGVGKFEDGLGLWLYFWMVILFCIGIYFMKWKNPFAVKYIILIGYNILDFIHNIMIYSGSDAEFDGGNIVEGFFILFAPIFVSKKYFWLVIGIIVGRYALIGIIIQSSLVLIPMALCSVFSIICWIIFLRFQSYIRTIEMMDKEIKQTEKLATVGKMATVIGYKIRRPLATLKKLVNKQANKHPEDKIYSDIMKQEVERIHTITTELSGFEKSKSIESETHNIQEIIAYVIRVMGKPALEQGVHIQGIYSKDIPSITCDEKRLKQVFFNLIKNGIEAMSVGGTITIKVTVEDGIVVQVKDEGCGIPKDKIPKLNEAFYTTKETGTGLGLVVTEKIIKDHNGKMSFESEVGVGTTVKVMLPM
ncbi:sensor histidine kinase [Bacillus toyonensis]|uniref:histidine kinase n=2 Tax=Bacillaceae TaxID=186817 RepID=A0A2B5JER1_9BACI|nr:ATP-binding protein [Bacillus toyonensis]PDY93061.1 sensor histidine kinase [Bacillus toyonensis]PEC08453.1 sensor histidine kinase [Bacillus toyonensis]PED94500.1 sensor histidine kinase [Bacillus toyonensis]PEJ66810.1 sensor histidine kinase [Bacillus toyonensis]PEK53025.1 sensor histidine kinase [Bacillus toyonensis]